MATTDVPGANPANNDELAAGCWAEHDDGSLIFVKGTENDQVVYEIYDLGVDPPVSYTDAMPAVGFKKAFSWGAGKQDRWLWHDKSPFPWNRVMQQVQRPRPGFASVEGQTTAAARVAESLKLRGKELAEATVSAQAERRGRSVLDRIQGALEELLR